ncbi:MAG: hypothetical protein HYR56_16940 [Acidobacteria bacterium]|nr:hypothetical protein [Acidobacteriota bacterium]MBI3428014.1 hypothetical protein [Acidobacteriota bacterium]
MFVDNAVVGYALDDSNFAAGAKRVVSAFKEILERGKESQKQVERLRDELGRFQKGPAASAASFGSFFKGADGIVGKLTGLVKSLYVQLAALAALAGGAGLFAAFLKQGVEFNATIQTSKLGIASLIATLGELKNASGQKLLGADALKAAIPLANDQIKKLRIAGLETAAATRQLIEGFQTSLGPGLSAGLNLDQIRQITIDLTQAASALGVPLREIGQETRAILSGDIDQNARVAKALGLTNPMVKSWREQNKLADELNKRLAVFRASGAEVAKTFDGVTSNFQEAVEVLGGGASEKLTTGFTQRLDKLTKSLFDPKALDIDAKLKPLLAFIDDIATLISGRLFDAADGFIRQLKEIGEQKKLLTEIVGEFDQLIDSVVGFGGSLDILPSKERLLQEIKITLQDTTSAVTELRDWFELLGAAGAAAMDGIGIAVLNLINEPLKLLGQEVPGIQKALDSLRQNNAFQVNRLDQGFINSRNLEDLRAYKARVFDAGNAVEVDPRTGKPATLSGHTPARPSASKSALHAAQQLAEARLSLLRSERDNELKLLEDQYKRQQDLLDESHKEGLTSEYEYIQQRAAIKTASVEAEIASQKVLAEETRKQIALIRKETPERLKLEEKLNDLLTEQTIKQRDLLEIERLRAHEREKLLKPIINLDYFKELASKPPELKLGEVPDPLAGLRQRGAAAELLQAQLRRDEEQVQARTTQGVVSETQGRRELLGVQTKYRDKLIEAYQAQKELVRATQLDPLTGFAQKPLKMTDFLCRLKKSGDKSFGFARASTQSLDFLCKRDFLCKAPLTKEIGLANLDVEIEQLKTLGKELNNTGRFAKGLGSEFTTGDFFEGLGGGLRDTIRQGFDDGFAGASLSFGKLLKRLAADLLTSELIKVLRNLFNPKATSTGTTSPTGTTGGGLLNSASNFLTGSGGGYGGFLTPSYSGAPIPGAGSGGSAVSNGGFNIRGILQRIPALGRLFGRSGFGSYAGTATSALGDLPKIPGVAIPQLGGGVAAAGSAVGGLGAAGALLGGGLLGQKAGGSSQIGQLLGGLGGTLGAGVLAGALGGTAAGAGIFGGAFGSALPALFSNPITAIVAGGLVGGALLFNYFGGKDFRKFKKTVKDEYDVSVDGKSGKAVFEQIKQLGESLYGKGQFKNNMLTTIRNEQAKELLAAYAESTGQTNSRLVKQLRETQQLQDQFNSANRFTRRLFGGPVSAGDQVFDGLRGINVGSGAEIFVPQTNGNIFPFDDFFERLTTSLAQRIPATTSTRASGAPTMGERIVAAAIERNTAALESLETRPAGHVVMTGLRESGRESAQTIAENLRNNPDAKRALFRDQL